MNSIRRRLITRLLGSLAILLLAGGSGVYFFTRAILLRDFDQLQRSRLSPIQGVIKQQIYEQYEPGKELGFEMRGEPPPYVQVWTPDGRLIGRSPSLAEVAVPFVQPRDQEISWFDLTLTNKHRARAMSQACSWMPAGTRERQSIERNSAPRSPERVQWERRMKQLPESFVVMVAVNRDELDSTLRRLSLVLWTVGSLLLMTTIIVVMRVSRWGLAPLDEVAAQASRIDATTLSFRFSTAALPAELKPIGERLNDSLARLENSFARERNFNSDVAHELRTPIAELRSLAEVALKWPSHDAETVEAFKDALDITIQMQGIVNGLLAIARCESGQQILVREAIAVPELVRKTWEPFAERAAGKQLNVQLQLAALHPPIETDRAMLGLILANLFSNAVEYTPRKGAIRIQLQDRGSGLDFTIANSVDNITAEDVAHLFDRFWRKDSARSSPEHSGIGLSVSQAYARVFGLNLEASLIEDGLLHLRLASPFSVA